MEISSKIHYHTLLNHSTGTCKYKKFPDGHIVRDEGNKISTSLGLTGNDCKQSCDESAGCNSFSRCDKLHGFTTCALKDKLLDGSEPTEYKRGCTTYYQHCSKKLYKFRLTIPLLVLENICGVTT